MIRKPAANSFYHELGKGLLKPVVYGLIGAVKTANCLFTVDCSVFKTWHDADHNCIVYLFLLVIQQEKWANVYHLWISQKMECHKSAYVRSLHTNTELDLFVGLNATDLLGIILLEVLPRLLPEGHFVQSTVRVLLQLTIGRTELCGRNVLNDKIWNRKWAKCSNISRAQHVQSYIWYY